MISVIQITEEGQVFHGKWPTEEACDALVEILDPDGEHVWLYKHDEDE